MLVSLAFLSLFHSKSSKLRTEKNFERLYTLVVVTAKITIFWDVTPFSLVEMQQCFGRTCCPKDGSGRSLHSITSQKRVIINNNFFSQICGILCPLPGQFNHSYCYPFASVTWMVCLASSSCVFDLTIVSIC